MPYVPPHLRNQTGQGDATGSRSLSDLANMRVDDRQRPGPARGGSHRGGGGGYGDASDGGRPAGWASTMCKDSARDARSAPQGAARQDVRHDPSDPAGRFSQPPPTDSRRFSQPVSETGYKHNPKGAPSRFGSAGRNQNRPLREGEDVPGGTRCDDDGMVYEMGGGACTYFQDRLRQYPFTCGATGLELLRRPLTVNKRVFALSDARVNATENPRETAAHGEHLYVMKPTMKSTPKSAGKGTWSDEEYAHPGLQALYLRLKSFQRFTESWALFERAGALGTFDPWLRPAPDAAADASTPAERPLLRVASLGGGPGYELLALQWFVAELAARRRVPPPRLELVSLDLQPSWEPYLHALSEGGGSDEGDKADVYRFAQWDIKSGVDAATAAGCALDLCLISNVLVYCTDEGSADVLAALLCEGGVQAILLNERGGEQKMCDMVQRRGVGVVKLLDQNAAGRDDRQLIFLPPAAPLPDAPTTRTDQPVFPNVPYEESKEL